MTRKTLHWVTGCAAWLSAAAYSNAKLAGA